MAIKNKNGFTIIETMISLFLILIALMFFLNLIIQAKSELKRSQIRFSLYQDYDNFANKLMSLPFNSGQNRFPGSEFSKNKIRVSYLVKNISDSLTKVTITISNNRLKIQSYLYKSRFINGGKHE